LRKTEWRRYGVRVAGYVTHQRDRRSYGKVLQTSSFGKSKWFMGCVGKISAPIVSPEKKEGLLSLGALAKLRGGTIIQ